MLNDKIAKRFPRALCPLKFIGCHIAIEIQLDGVAKHLVVFQIDSFFHGNKKGHPGVAPRCPIA